MSSSNYKLVQSIRIAADAKKLLQNLDQIAASVYSPDSRHEEISKVLTITQRQLLIEDLQSNNTTLSDPEARAIISDIRNAIEKIPVATIELAFNPSAEFTEELADTINSMSKSTCVVEVKYNPNIGGGMIIFFEGRHYDYSLNDKFNEIAKI